MKLRISNGNSFAVEFNAATEIEYRRGFQRAALAFFAHKGRRAVAQLQVASDFGEWLSPYFPRSNSECCSYWGKLRIPDWSTVCLSNQRSTWMRYELRSLVQFVTQ